MTKKKKTRTIPTETRAKAKELRRELDACPRNHLGRIIGADLRSRIAAFYRQARAAGVMSVDLAKLLGISDSQLHRWKPFTPPPGDVDSSPVVEAEVVVTRSGELDDLRDFYQDVNDIMKVADLIGLVATVDAIRMVCRDSIEK
jgi:hypothetical protein